MFINRASWMVFFVIALFVALPTAVADDEEADGDGEEETAQAAPAASNGAIQLLEAKTAAGVEDREAVNEGDSFSVGDSVTVWMAFRNPESAQEVEVAWKAGDAEIHTYKINIGESWRWRTWASLAVGRAGDWTVEIRDGEGNSLETVSFTVNE